MHWRAINGIQQPSSSPYPTLALDVIAGHWSGSKRQGKNGIAQRRRRYRLANTSAQGSQKRKTHYFSNVESDDDDADALGFGHNIRYICEAHRPTRPTVLQLHHRTPSSQQHIQYHHRGARTTRFRVPRKRKTHILGGKTIGGLLDEHRSSENLAQSSSRHLRGATEVRVNERRPSSIGLDLARELLVSNR